MDAGAAVKIEYELTPDDLVALRHFYATRVTDPRRRRSEQRWLSAFGAAVTLGLLTLYVDSSFRPESVLVAAAIAAPAILFVFFGVFAYMDRRLESPSAVRKNLLYEIGRTDEYRHVFGPKRLSVDARGFRLFGDGTETSFEWRVVPKILRGDEHLYLCETFSKDGLTATIVPGRAFASPTAFDEFCGLVEGAWRAARVEAVLRKGEGLPDVADDSSARAGP